MIDENIRFEKQGDLHKLFYNNGYKEYDMGVAFITEHNIEDYPITILEQINGRDCYLNPCKDVVIKLLNPPEKTKRIEIARDADIEFSGDFVLGIEKSLRIETNKGAAFSFKDNPNREKFVRFKELEISRNENSTFYFSKSNVNRIINPLLLDSITKGISKISNNNNIFFSFREDIQGLELKDNSYNGGEANGEIICDNLYTHLDSLQIIDNGLFDDEPASLTLSADAVYLINSKLDIAGSLEIVNKGTKSLGGSKISISNTDIEKPYDSKEAGALEIDCDYLQIDTNVSFVISGENKIECLGGKVIIDNTGDNLHDPMRLDNSKIFIPEGGEAVIRRIEGNNSSLALTQSEENKYSIKRAYLENSEAKNISGDIYLYAENSKIDGMTFEKNSGVVLTTHASTQNSKTNFVVENILFKKDSSLEIKDTKGKDAHIKLSNIIVEGEASLVSGLDFTMEKSILAKGATYLISNDEGLKILNSIIQGRNTIEGVSSITNSKVENSFISGERVKIEDEEMVGVSDYKAYTQQKAKDAFVVTNEVERL